MCKTNLVKTNDKKITRSLKSRARFERYHTRENLDVERYLLSTQTVAIIISLVEALIQIY